MMKRYANAVQPSRASFCSRCRIAWSATNGCSKLGLRKSLRGDRGVGGQVGSAWRRAATSARRGRSSSSCRDGHRLGGGVDARLAGGLERSTTRPPPCQAVTVANSVSSAASCGSKRTVGTPSPAPPRGLDWTCAAHPLASLACPRAKTTIDGDRGRDQDRPVAGCPKAEQPMASREPNPGAHQRAGERHPEAEDRALGQELRVPRDGHQHLRPGPFGREAHGPDRRPDQRPSVSDRLTSARGRPRRRAPRPG